MGRNRKPLGRALRWSPAALLALATPQVADVAPARRLWQQAAPKPVKRLLDAQEEGTPDGP